MGSVSASLFTRDNLESFGRTFDRYVFWSGKTRQECVTHAAKNFQFFLYKRMASAAAPKGAITAERLEAFKSGEGIKISRRAREIVYRKYGVNFVFKPGPGGTHSPSVTMGPKGSKYFMTGSADKKRGLTKKQQTEIEALNKATGGGITLQALLAKQELKLREEHRLFTASSTRFKVNPEASTFSISKLRTPLGKASPKQGPDESSFAFEWGSAVAKWSGEAAKGLNSAARRKLFDPALNDTRLDALKYIDRKQKEAGQRAARVL